MAASPLGPFLPLSGKLSFPLYTSAALAHSITESVGIYWTFTNPDTVLSTGAQTVFPSRSLLFYSKLKQVSSNAQYSVESA